MVDSRAKGAAGERQVRDVLRSRTGLDWQRVPLSGALEYMKGDLFIPNAHNNYCVEVKFYKDSHFNDKILTNKIFAATKDKPSVVNEYMYVNQLGCYVMEMTNWLVHEKPSFTNG